MNYLLKKNVLNIIKNVRTQNKNFSQVCLRINLVSVSMNTYREHSYNKL